jgi:hypothetical protein
MESSNMTALPSRRALPWLPLAVRALPLILAAGCGSGGGGGGMTGTVGDELDKPDGSGTFFNDKNEGGEAGSLKIVSLSWGRIVDIHDIDELTGEADPQPVFRDFVVNETIQTDGQNYILETNPVTQKTRLIVLREKKDDATDEFIPLVKLAEQDLAPVQEKSDAPGTLPPFSLVSRNSALVIRFNDLLDDDTQATLKLPDNVRLFTDYPPTLPYQNKRLLFDQNHGGIAEDGGGFHSSRVIVDMTVSESEAASMAVPVGINSLGLPASQITTPQANVSVRIPSAIVPAVGQFSILTNLAGNGSAISGNGPVDFSSPTLDVVRAMRSGNEIDENNGFLLDLNLPELLSGWPVQVTNATDDPAGDAGFDFIVDLTFTSPCQSQPEPGNILELPGVFAEISTLGLPPDLQGDVLGVEVRSLGETPIGAASLLGGGLFKRTFDASLFSSSLQGCWVSFAPAPGVFPATSVVPNSQVVLRFSEPMDPATVSPFDSFLVKSTQEDNPSPLKIVVGEVDASGDLKEFTYTPLLPFNHSLSTAEVYYVNLLGQDGITDLAGNPPVDLPEQIEFTMDPAASTVSNGGIALTLNSLDEVKHPDIAGIEDFAPDWRGQFLFDPERGVLKPRPVVRSSAIADRSQAVPGIMTPFAQGVQTPLAPLGSKMMTVWRYCDVGFSSQDESNYNLDIEGLDWSPIGAQVVSDFYPEFEMRLSHSHFLPDEALDANGFPAFQDSGLRDKTLPFTANILIDPASPQKIVHPRELGYVLNPVDLFLSSTGTFMMPFPLNRNTPPSEDVYFTWRDTATQKEAGPSNAGMDLQIMEDVGLIPSDDPPPVVPPGWSPPPGSGQGYIANTNAVPSIGLPLLMEFRCYPAEEGVGLNAFDISLAVNTSAAPSFRSFSTGGLNATGQLITKDPDLEVSPSGGFNGVTGAVTPEIDNTFYIGQMDVISRISRVHTIWLDTEQAGAVTDFLDPVVKPTPEEQPSGTELVFAFRGASTIVGESIAVNKAFAFNANFIDPYGDVRKQDNAFLPAIVPEFLSSLASDITFLPVGDKTWKNDIDELDQARYFQMRVTFVGNTTTLLNPELSAVGVAWVIN